MKDEKKVNKVEEARGRAEGRAEGEANAMRRFLEMLNSGMSREEILAACRS